MKKFLLLLSFVPSLLFGATGDVTAVTVLADGWQADVTVEGFTTGATYDFDLDGNNIPTATTPYLTVVSEGFDDTGTLSTITRTVYLTDVVRKVYPNEAQQNETGGGNLTTRFALSDYVFLDDNTGAGKSGTAPAVTLKAGFIVNSGGGAQSNAAATAAAVTNSSTLTYPLVTANWAWVDYERVTGNFPLRAVAFSPHGQQKRPVRCVKFTAADTSAHTATTIVTTPTYDASVGDAVPVIEYVGTMDVSTLTALEVLTCNFIAYPWVGDASSILDTSTGTAAPSPLYGPLPALNDKSNTYGVTVAYVASGGSDAGANTAYDFASYPGDATAYKFATINGALLAIKTYNNTNRSRNSVSGGIVYVGDGTWVWTGGSSSYSVTGDTWVTVTRSATSTSRAAVIIGSMSGNSSINGKTKIMDMTLTATTNLFFSGDSTNLWFDQCTINYTGAAMLYANTFNVAYTRCAITNAVQGMTNPSGKTVYVGLIRGSTIASNDAIRCYTVVGNDRSGSTTQTGGLTLSTAAIGYTDNVIIAYNKWMKQNSTGFLTVANLATDRMAIVQNVMENIGTAGGYFLSIGADSSTSGDVNNVIIWNNTFVGQRLNLAYNDTSTSAPLRTKWSVKNNLADDYNIKSDLFGTPNAARVNNWSQLHGVLRSGNIFADATAAIGASGLRDDFYGLSGDQPLAPAVTYLAYIDRQAFIGSGTATGNGSYRLQTSSPAYRLQRDALLPYDIAGRPRSTNNDSAGAYAEGGTRPASMFFAQ